MNFAALLIQNKWVQAQADKRKKQKEEEVLSEKYISLMGYGNDSNRSKNNAAELAFEEEEKEEAMRHSLANLGTIINSPKNETEFTLGDVEMGLPNNNTNNITNNNTNTITNETIPIKAATTTTTTPAISSNKNNNNITNTNTNINNTNTTITKSNVEVNRPTLIQKKEEIWIKPSLDIAKAYADGRHPRKYAGEHDKFTMWETTTGRHCCVGGLGEQCDLFGEGQVSEFGQYGPGVTNYFKFLKWNIWVFLMLSVLSLIPLTFNYYGPGEQNTGLSTLAKTTAGNLVSITNTTADIAIPGCSGYDYNGIDCAITPPQLASLYAYVDVISMIFVLIAYVWLRIYEKKEVILLDQATVNLADFSVKFTNLPKECTPAELKAFLAKTTNQSIASVYFAYDSQNEIEGYRERGKLVQQKFHVKQKKLYYTKLLREHQKIQDPTCGWCCGYGYFYPCKCKKDYKDELELWSKLDKENAELGMKIKKKNLELDEKASQSPIMAFVTFETKIGALVAKSTFTTSWLTYCCTPAKNLFKGYALRIDDAPEPSTIIWENLNYGYYERLKRRYRTAIIAGLLIFISFIARLFSTVVERSAQGVGGSEPCPSNFDQLTIAQQEEMVQNDSQILHCYCDAIALSDQNNPLCEDYYQQQLKANLLNYGASFLVVAINMALEWAVNIFADYEKHHSIDSQGRSVFNRLFWLYLLNSAVVFIIQVNSKDLGFMQQITGYAAAPTVINFTADWYVSVGAGIIIVQLTGTVFNQLYNLYLYYQFAKTKYAAKNNPLLALTQDELNALHLGPQFKLSVRYAQQLSTFFVSLLFSTGIPLLNMIGAFNFIFVYFTEKFLFVNYYRIPPRYNTSISMAATRLMPYAVVMHLIFSIWTLSINQLFANTDSNNIVSEQAAAGAAAANNSFVYNCWLAASKRETLPILILLVLVVLALLIEFVAERFFGSVTEAFIAVFGNVCSKWSYMNEIRKYNDLKRKNAKTKDSITYTRAVQRGIFKGLATYNILQNPYYMEAFSISSKFAAEHTSVGSLRFTKKNLDNNAYQEAIEANVIF